MLILITHLLPQLPGPGSQQRPICPIAKVSPSWDLGSCTLTERLIYHSKYTVVSFLHNSRQSPFGVWNHRRDRHSTGGRDRDINSKVYSAENKINRKQMQARKENGLSQPRGYPAGTRGSRSHRAGSKQHHFLIRKGRKGCKSFEKMWHWRCLTYMEYFLWGLLY